MITNPNDLIKALDALPQKIRDQKIKVIDAERVKNDTKLKYDVAFGVALIEAQAPNATQKKAIATTKTEKKAEDLIASEYNLKKEEAGLKFLEDKFISLRKISSIEQELMRVNISGT